MELHAKLVGTLCFHNDLFLSVSLSTKIVVVCIVNVALLHISQEI